MPADTPPLPAGDVLPSIPELAELLTSMFPESERAAARAALTGEVLPWDLRSLAVHPRPRAYLELVYEELAGKLGVDPAQRSARLAELRCDRTIQRLTDRIAGLAIARYLRDRTGPRPAGVSANDLTVAEPFLAIPPDAFTAELQRTTADFAGWQERALADHPACFQARRADIQHDQLALDSARTGSFAAASGYLLGFLHRAGERPREIGVH